MLPALALPLWSVAADTARAGQGTIILAQAVPNETPEQRRIREQKAKQPAPAPRGAPPVQQVPPVQNVPKQQPQAIPQPKQPQVVPQPKQPAQVPQPVQPKQPAQVVPPPPPPPAGAPQSQQPAQVVPQQTPQTGQQKTIPKRDGQPKNAPVVAQPPAGQPPVAQPPAGGPQSPYFRQVPGQKGGPVQVGRPGAPAGPADVNALRGMRQERREPGGRVVIMEPGGRSIVREGDRVIIRSNEALRFSRFGQPMVTRRGAETFNIVRRPDGVEIITVTDANGNLLRRLRRGPDGREVLLIDNRRRAGIGIGGAVVGAGLFLGLAAPVIMMPRERYIVDVGGAPPALLVDTLMAPPVMAMERPYTLDEIRYNVQLRDRMPRIDIDTVTFSTGSWEVTPDQYPALEAIAQAILSVIARNPNEVFLIEGHTDAVGNPDDNLSLSDRRAETVAVILSDTYMVPAENLVTQGYGAQFLKVPTQEALRENRRVAIRRITPLLGAQQ
jgi:outer membrane protein OmpA-like peptidoglycan-associated protein